MSRLSSARARRRLRGDRRPGRARNAQVRRGRYTCAVVAVHIESTHVRAPSAALREALAAPAVAVVTLILALLGTHAAGVRFRDPDNVAAKYVVIMVLSLIVLVALDVAIRTGRREGTWRPSRAAMGELRRTRWTPRRMVAAGGGLLSFYLAYLGFRNLKGALPFLRPELTDGRLAQADRDLFLGHDPAALLHGLLGTGVAAHVLAAVYAAFIVFLPLSLAVALVFSSRLSTSLFFATAMSLNWLIGTGSYYLLPSLGPAYANPPAFAALPYTEATRLQAMLLSDRAGFLRSPDTGIPQAIAAFASLHIAMSFTALAMTYLLGLGRRVKAVLWTWLALTAVATVYLGWHYAIDDIAGVVIGLISLVLAKLLTAYDVRAARRAPSA
jgi:membrane-associated phospholipid phosphatase